MRAKTFDRSFDARLKPPFQIGIAVGDSWLFREL